MPYNLHVDSISIRLRSKYPRGSYFKWPCAYQAFKLIRLPLGTALSHSENDSGLPFDLRFSLKKCRTDVYSYLVSNKLEQTSFGGSLFHFHLQLTRWIYRIIVWCFDNSSGGWLHVLCWTSVYTRRWRTSLVYGIGWTYVKKSHHITAQNKFKFSLLINDSS